MWISYHEPKFDNRTLPTVGNARDISRVSARELSRRNGTVVFATRNPAKRKMRRVPNASLLVLVGPVPKKILRVSDDSLQRLDPDPDIALRSVVGRKDMECAN